MKISPLSSRFPITLFSFLTLLILSCNSTEVQNQNKQNKEASTTQEEVTAANGLIYEILKPGAGPAAREGQEVLIHERTMYLDSTLIFDSHDMGQPLKFLIGGNMVIEGVDQGVRGMQKGEIRKLIVPPSLSQRTSYPDFLSPDSTLLYIVDLVDIVEND